MSLQAALENTAKAASNRAAEGQKLFSPIATLLDKHLHISTNLSPHLLSALNALSTDLITVAQRHFDAYITGSTYIPGQEPKPPSPPLSRPTSGLAQSTYATVASSNPLAKPTPLTKATPNKALKEPTPDNRLFVRLPDGHDARKVQGFAIRTNLRAELGSDGPLLKEVQAIRTGFALCPSSPAALKILEDKKKTISDFFGNDCLVERGSRWVSYRLTNITRHLGPLEYGPSAVQVDSKRLAQEVIEATGIIPISVIETRYSASNPALPYSCWFVNFPEGTSQMAIPRQLRLFGMVATATYLPRKTTTIQCNRCWMWHNARSCSRPPRCKLCGSTKHTEEGHSSHCEAPPPHVCPPRCMHCHGPHPADSIDCPLRRHASKSPTKLQKSEIRSSGSAMTLQTRTKAGCTYTPVQDHVIAQDQMAIDTITVSLPEPTPRPHSPPKATPTAKRAKHSNRFDAGESPAPS